LGGFVVRWWKAGFAYLDLLTDLAERFFAMVHLLEKSQDCIPIEKLFSQSHSWVTQSSVQQIYVHLG
jgi:hypothetical protein